MKLTKLMAISRLMQEVYVSTIGPHNIPACLAGLQEEVHEAIRALPDCSRKGWNAGQVLTAKQLAELGNELTQLSEQGRTLDSESLLKRAGFANSYELEQSAKTELSKELADVLLFLLATLIHAGIELDEFEHIALAKLRGNAERADHPISKSLQYADIAKLLSSY